ncbi:MAG: hypothetical protein Q4F05_09240 [bacterium]|nr:hypothetical protein [bacterium]
MEDKLVKEETLIQNLKDAGCSDKCTNEFMKQEENENTAEQLRILKRQRSLLLHQIHSYNEKLDCLDYLIYKINGKRSGGK